MVLATQSAVGILCPECGEIEYMALSLFSFAKAKEGKETLTCQCGASLLTVASKNRQQFSIAFLCAFCGNIHYIRIPRRAIWGNKPYKLICPEMDSTVGFIGPKGKVSQAWQEQKDINQSLFEELGLGEEYENAEVMLAILDHLHDLAKKDGLECSCGNTQLSYDLLSDRIEIYCEHCEALGIIFADCKENVKIIQGMEFLKLEKNKTKYFNHAKTGLHLAITIKEE